MIISTLKHSTAGYKYYVTFIALLIVLFNSFVAKQNELLWTVGKRR